MNYTKWMRTGLTFFTAATLALTAGCGGGGGGSSTITDPSDPVTPPVPAPVIKGFWGASDATGSTTAIILANGDSWVVFVESGTATSFSRLQTTTDGASFTGAGTRYLLQTGTTETATASGTFAEKVSITGSTVSSSSTNSLNLAYNTQYDTTAAIADADGTWSGSYRGGSSTMTLAVASGVITGTSTTGCSYNGTLHPRSADPAVFDLLAFTETCPGSSTLMTGIATVNTAKTNFTFAATTVDKAQGALFSGARQ